MLESTTVISYLTNRCIHHLIVIIQIILKQYNQTKIWVCIEFQIETKSKG